MVSVVNKQALKLLMYALASGGNVEAGILFSGNSPNIECVLELLLTVLYLSAVALLSLLAKFDFESFRFRSLILRLPTICLIESLLNVSGKTGYAI